MSIGHVSVSKKRKLYFKKVIHLREKYKRKKKNNIKVNRHDFVRL